MFNTKKVAEHSERLNKNLLGYNLKLATMAYGFPADSIFLSIVSQLKEVSTSSSTLQKHLCCLRISLAESSDLRIVKELRELVVNEMLNNLLRYKHALLPPNEHYEEEVNKYRESGYFSSKCTHLFDLILQGALEYQKLLNYTKWYRICSKVLL